MKENDNYTKNSVMDIRKIKSIETINYIINDLGFSNANQLSEALGLSRPEKVYKILRGDNAISKKFAEEINQIFPKYSVDEILSGKFSESLLKQGIGVTDKSKPLDSVTPIPNENYMWVEYADLSAAAGQLGGSDIDTLPETKKRLVPREYENGEYLVIRVDGDSMDDGSKYSIPDGTEILIKKYYLSNGDKLPIRNNLFVINAREGKALKQIVEHNTEEGYIICHSYNSDFKDYKIQMEDILEIFIYRKIVSSRPPIPDIN